MLRRVLRRVLGGRSALIVTHDVLDAVLLADRVVVVERGRIVEQGPTAQVIARPRTAFTAGIAGLNLIRGRVTAESVLADDHGVEVTGTPTEPLTTGERGLAVFSPNAVAVYDAPRHGSPRNTFAVTITELEPRESLVRVRAVDRSGDTLLADVTASAVGELDLFPGNRVCFTVKATAVTLYPA
jgi:molybdate transport system ATP-binding protein